MSPAAFFFIVLATQALFTVGLIWIVVRRFPKRVASYRFIAPAPVPVLLFLIVSLHYVESLKAQGVPLDTIDKGPIAQFVMAYAILWLIGLILVSAVIRWTQR